MKSTIPTPFLYSENNCTVRGLRYAQPIKEMQKLHLFMVPILALISTLITSCSNSQEPQPQPIEEGKTYEVSLNLGGEYTSVTEEPLSRDGEAPKKYYGINVYCMKTDGTETDYHKYAFGVFDNVADMKITLLGGYKYKFECTSATEDVDLFYVYDNHIFSPFHTSYTYTFIDNTTCRYFSLYNLNTFITSQDNYLPGIQSGRTSYSGKRYSTSDTYYPRADRYYGELTDFIPSDGGVAVIPMLRTVFGIKIIVNGVPDGRLDWKISKVSMQQSYSDQAETTTVSQIFTFYRVYECWKSDSYYEDFDIEFTWLRSNGYKQTFNEKINVKRNIMTTVTVNLKGGTTDVAIGVNEEDTPMGNEDVTVEYDGGNLNDTPVNPEE